MVYVESLIFIPQGLVWHRVVCRFSARLMAESPARPTSAEAAVAAPPSKFNGISAVIFVTNNRTGYHGCKQRGR